MMRPCAFNVIVSPVFQAKVERIPHRWMNDHTLESHISRDMSFTLASMVMRMHRLVVQFVENPEVTNNLEAVEAKKQGRLLLSVERFMSP